MPVRKTKPVEANALAAFDDIAREEAEHSAAQEAGFAWFQRSSPAREMFCKLGFLDYLEAATSWRMLRNLIVDRNDIQERGVFVNAARHCNGVCSSGERILLHAILYATDYAWLADELGGKEVWRNMNRASGPHLRAVQACIGAWA